MSRTSAFGPFDILEQSKKLVVACYMLTGNLPTEEKTALTLYMRNAALTVHLNSVQASFIKKKKAKKNFIKGAKNSLVVIEAVADVLIELGFIKEQESTEVMQLSSTCYQLLDRLKKQK